ncbi:MAG: hypothetical protein ACNA7G_07650 [Methylobacter sp.]
MPIKDIACKVALYSLLTFLATSAGLCVLLRWLPVPTSAFMVYRHVEDLIDGRPFKPISYSWVDAKKISGHAFSAVIAAEDQRFFNTPDLMCNQYNRRLMCT